MFPASNLEADTLAHLALKAATEIDRLERNRSSDLGALTEFVEAITHLSVAENAQGPSPLFMDPVSSEMLSEAVKSTALHEINSIDALATELNRVTAEMRDLTSSGTPSGALKSLKLFCLFIHDFVQKNRLAYGLSEKGVFDYDHSFAG